MSKPNCDAAVFNSVQNTAADAASQNQAFVAEMRC